MGEYDYARPRWWQWRRRDIERRKHLAFSEEDDVRTAVPFERALWAIGWLWIFLSITFFLHVWVFEVLDPLYNFFWWFLAYTCFSGFVVIELWFFKWSWKHWPQTPMVIANGRRLLAPDWKPGMYVDSVTLPLEKKKAGQPDPQSETAEVEYVPCRWGTSQVAVPRRMPYLLVLLRNIEVVDPVTNKPTGEKRAVLSDGIVHFAAKKGKWYRAGDLRSWRGVDWYERARKKVGKRVKRKTWIGVFLDPYFPYTWMPPGDKPGIEKELFEEQARNRSIETKSTKWLGRDAVRKGIERRLNE
jgi:hypothetical protein